MCGAQHGMLDGDAGVVRAERHGDVAFDRLRDGVVTVAVTSRGCQRVSSLGQNGIIAIAFRQSSGCCPPKSKQAFRLRTGAAHPEG